MRASLWLPACLWLQDLKSPNLLLTDDLRVKVADFGLSSLQTTSDPFTDSAVLMSAARTGVRYCLY